MSSRELRKVKNQPGIWRRGGGYVVRYRTADGKQKQEAAATLAEARDLRSARTSDVARGEFTRLSRVTFAEYAAAWLGSYTGRTARGVRPETREQYAQALGFRQVDDGSWEPIEPARGAVAYFGRRLLTELEPRDVRAYAAEVGRRVVDRKTGRCVSQNTVRLAVAPVKALLATAVEDRLLRWNPAAGVRLTNASEKLSDNGEEQTVKALTTEQLAALIDETPDDWRLLVRFLAATGLRISEALALTWADIDFGGRKLTVRRRLVAGKLAPPKSRYGRRTIRLSPGVAQGLWEARKAAGRDRSDAAPVFQRRDGSPLDRHRAFHVVKEAGKRAGVPWAGLHTLRHTCATMLFRNGLNAKQVQVWLGHHSPAFTLSVYVHLLGEDLPDADFMDALVAAEGVNAGSPRPTENSRDAATGTPAKNVAFAG